MPLQPEPHCLTEALADLRLPSNDGVCLVCSAPARWDELLDAGLPLVISSTVGPWEQLCSNLWEAGLANHKILRLVEDDGRVKAVEFQDEQLVPRPESARWTLAVGWTHPEEGWRARLPLFGRHYLVTRAPEQAAGLVERLQDLGAQATSVPTIQFVDPDDLGPWQHAVKNLSEFQWLIFTSPNGVRTFLERLAQSEQDLRAIKGRIACIGPSTARSLARSGLKADLVPEQYVAEDLLRVLSDQLQPGDRILIPRAQVARDVLPEGLKALGAEVLVAPVYKTVRPDLQTTQLPDEARLLFTSSSTVKNWVELTPDVRFPCFCIGPITAGTAKESGLEILGVAQEFTIDGLVECLLKSDSHVEFVHNSLT